MRRRTIEALRRQALDMAIVVNEPETVVSGRLVELKAEVDTLRRLVPTEKREAHVCKKCGRHIRRGWWMHEKHCKG